MTTSPLPAPSLPLPQVPRLKVSDQGPGSVLQPQQPQQQPHTSSEATGRKGASGGAQAGLTPEALGTAAVHAKAGLVPEALGTVAGQAKAGPARAPGTTVGHAKSVPARAPGTTGEAESTHRPPPAPALPPPAASSLGRVIDLSSSPIPATRSSSAAHLLLPPPPPPLPASAVPCNPCAPGGVVTRTHGSSSGSSAVPRDPSVVPDAVATRAHGCSSGSSAVPRDPSVVPDTGTAQPPACDDRRPSTRQACGGSSGTVQGSSWLHSRSRMAPGGAAAGGGGAVAITMDMLASPLPTRPAIPKLLARGPPLAGVGASPAATAATAPMACPRRDSLLAPGPPIELLARSPAGIQRQLPLRQQPARSPAGAGAGAGQPLHAQPQWMIPYPALSATTT